MKKITLGHSDLEVLAQLDENLAAWGTTISPELLAAIDRVRLCQRDPAQ